jgi:hypothetical protein
MVMGGSTRRCSAACGRFRSRIDAVKRASYRALAGLLAIVGLRALSAWLVAAEAGPQEAIEAPDPDDREPASIRAAVVERAVTEVRPAAVLPFNNSAAFEQPPVNRRWQQSDILGSPTALLAASAGEIAAQV